MQGMRIPRESPAGWLIDAPAKLNVYLDVLSRRPDGFHGIRTLLCPVRLADTLRIEPDDSLGPGVAQLTVRSLSPAIDVAGVPTDESNLVLRALRSVWRLRGLRPGCRITLYKRVPTQAGLGGGSGDAAAAMVAANHIWGMGLSEAELLQAAAGVGSDVPGQLSGRAALCEGRGEIVTPASAPAGLPCVIAKPRRGLSTAEVFRRCEADHREFDSRWPANDRLASLLAALRRGALGELPNLIQNQLQAAALQLCSELRALAAAFSQLPFVAHQMTGSGSAYFGLCRSYRESMQAAAWLRSRQAAWAVATCTA